MIKNGLNVDDQLISFIEKEALPGTGVKPAAFWKSFSAIAHELAPINRALLKKRDAFQAEIDEWNRAHKGAVEPKAYHAFLRKIGYIVPEGKSFKISGVLH